MAVTSLDVARVAALAADDKKAQDIVVLNLSELSDVCDYFVICTAASSAQMDAVIDEIKRKVRVNCEIKPLSSEGGPQASWLLLDFGSVVVHVFKPEAREYYRLENLWGDAPRLELDLSE